MVGGVGEGKGRSSGEECWGQRGENNGVTKAAIFHSCGKGKTGILLGQTFGREIFRCEREVRKLLAPEIIFYSYMANYDIMVENLFVLHAKKVQVLKINVSNSKLRLSIQFKYGSLS